MARKTEKQAMEKKEWLQDTVQQTKLLLLQTWVHILIGVGLLFSETMQQRSQKLDDEERAPAGRPVDRPIGVAQGSTCRVSC